jgi:hypothetical protein
MGERVEYSARVQGAGEGDAPSMGMDMFAVEGREIPFDRLRTSLAVARLAAA